MKFRFPILLAASVFFLLSCDKDTFETKPSINVKSLSSTVVPDGGTFNITLEYTDKEGDVSDSIFMVMQIMNENQRGLPQEFTNINYKIPGFPESRRGEISASFIVNRQPPSYVAPLQVLLTNQNDTVNFKIWVRDKAQNYSDTITTEQIVFIR
jgi:hypothetical protein